MMKAEEMLALGGLITTIAAACALVIKQISASKCKKIKCGGCCEIDRKVDAPTIDATMP